MFFLNLLRTFSKPFFNVLFIALIFMQLCDQFVVDTTIKKD